MMVLAIAARELRALFLSPLAWAVLAVMLLIHAYLFLSQIEQYLAVQSQLVLIEGAPGVTEVVVSPLFGSAAVVLLLVVPLLTMRLISEERRSHTLSLLLSAPVSMAEIVIGKYLGIVAFLLILLALLGLMPLSLLVGGVLDFGLLAAGLLGLGLMLAAFAAVGLFMSTLTIYPAVAAVSSFGVLLLLWIVDWAGNVAGEGGSGGALAYFSMMNHFQALLRGVFDTADIAYFVLFAVTFLVLSILRLEADRLP